MLGSLTSGEGVMLLVRGPGSVWVQSHKAGAHGSRGAEGGRAGRRAAQGMHGQSGRGLASLFAPSALVHHYRSRRPARCPFPDCLLMCTRSLLLSSTASRHTCGPRSFFFSRSLKPVRHPHVGTSKTLPVKLT